MTKASTLSQVLVAVFLIITSNKFWGSKLVVLWIAENECKVCPFMENAATPVEAMTKTLDGMCNFFSNFTTSMTNLVFPVLVEPVMNTLFCCYVHWFLGLRCFLSECLLLGLVEYPFVPKFLYAATTIPRVKNTPFFKLLTYPSGLLHKFDAKRIWVFSHKSGFTFEVKEI